PADSFRNIAELRMKKLQRRGRSESYLKNMRYAFEKHVYPSLGAKPIGNITKADVLSALSVLDEGGHTTTYNRVLTMIRPVFALADVPDPSIRIEKYPEKTSEAWFTLDEIANIWVALDAAETKVHPMTSLAVKFGILTLKRAREVAGARFDEFDESVWRIPADRMKARRLEVVPFTEQMRALVKAARHHERRPLISTDSPFLFQSTHIQNSPIDSSAMSRAFPRARRQAGLEEHKGTLHSLRHSGATILASSKISPYIVSALLSHQLAASGVAKVTGRYNMYDLLDERREALETWNRMVMSSVAKLRSETANVNLAVDLN
ncbi:MAG: tyrosine-type recombinase/integrase, partial [Pseudomonadota bacterium]